MLAQVDTSWPSLILQGGAFGLIVYIVTVMYPKATAMAVEERERRDGRFIGALDQMNAQFNVRITMMVAATKEATETLAKSVHNQAETLAASVQQQAETLAASGQQQAETLALENKAANALIVAALGSVCKAKL